MSLTSQDLISIEPPSKKCFSAFITTRNHSVREISSLLNMTYQMFYICNELTNDWRYRTLDYSEKTILRNGSLVCGDCSDIRGGCDKYLVTSNLTHSCKSLSQTANVTVKELQSLNPQLNCSNPLSYIISGTPVCLQSANCLEIRHLPSDALSQLSCSVLQLLNRKDSIYRCNAFIDCGELQPGTSVCMNCRSPVNKYGNLALPAGYCLSSYYPTIGDTCDHIKALYNVSEEMISYCSLYDKSSVCDMMGKAKLCVRCHSNVDELGNISSITAAVIPSSNMALILAITIFIGIAVSIISGGMIYYYRRKSSGQRLPPEKKDSGKTSQSSIFSPFSFSYIQSSRLYEKKDVASDNLVNENLKIKIDKRIVQSMHDAFQSKSFETTGSSMTKTFTFTYVTSHDTVSVPGYLNMQLDENFNLDKKIDSGGTADLYLAYFKKSLPMNSCNAKSPFAIKIPRAEATPSQIDFFMFEIAIMSVIPKSKNLVEFVGYSDKPLAIIMKHYNMSLKDLIETTNNPNEIKSLNLKAAFDICNGMRTLHESGILHLDLKTANILVDGDGKKFDCVVCDFGYANVIKRHSSNFIIPKGLGVPTNFGLSIRYAAPELFTKIDSQSKRFDSESDKMIDVYSFAIILYELISRNKAWKGFGADVIVKKVLKGDRPSLDSPNFEEQAFLTDIMAKTWCQEPIFRLSFQTIFNFISSAMQNKK